jgi:hypothetical protein
MEVLGYLRDYGSGACAADKGVMCGIRIESIG